MRPWPQKNRTPVGSIALNLIYGFLRYDLSRMRFAIIALLFVPTLIFGAEIPKGTHVLLRMVNSISSKSAHEGDYVYLRTASPIVVGGQIVVPVDAYVQGVVSHVRRSGRVSGRAELGVRIEVLTFPNGTTLKFTPRVEAPDSREGIIKQDPQLLKDAATIAILAGAGASIGGIADRSWTGAGIGGAAGSAVGLATVLLTRGKEVELHQGDTFDAVLNRAVVLE
jgi:hypothetical protein